jgi:hypothetical protein
LISLLLPTKEGGFLTPFMIKRDLKKDVISPAPNVIRGTWFRLSLGYPSFQSLFLSLVILNLFQDLSWLSILLFLSLSAVSGGTDLSDW